MNEKHKELALRGLGCLRGDDLERARHAFHGMGSMQMQEQHGQSGKTRAEILARYEKFAAEVDAAVQWVKAQK